MINSKNKQNKFIDLKKICIVIFILLFYIIIFIYINKFTYKYTEDELTLVTAYYRIKSKHLPEEYLKWLNNLLLLNRSFVIYSNKEFMPTLKNIRPKEYHYKTVFIELEMENFYSYKNFYKEFNASFEIDIENRIHTVPLYLIWAEKAMFIRKVILHNYFNSKCFYWIDAGYFRDDRKNMTKYINNWPSTKKCHKDKRVLLGQIKKFSEEEKRNIINFVPKAHKRLQRHINVCGNFFGGQAGNIIKFTYYYYEALKLFIKNNIFIGKDQNIFTYVVFKHRSIIKIVFCKNYKYFKSYLS